MIIIRQKPIGSDGVIIMATFESAYNKWKSARDADDALGTAETRAAVADAHHALRTHSSVVNARGQLESAENARRHDARLIPGSNG